MKIVTEKYLCDRCFEELPRNRVYRGVDYPYGYDLCEKCHNIYHLYKDQLRLVDNKKENIQECFKFGKYLPKPKENVDD